jgi:CRISPR-associated endonuclease/helicase Cas3
MPVPLHVIRAWWRAGGGDDDAGARDLADVEGSAVPADEDPNDGAARLPVQLAAVRWLGPDDSEPLSSADDIRPGDTVVLPELLGGWNTVGHVPDGTDWPIDAGDLAHRQMSGRAILRLHPTFAGRLPPSPARERLRELIQAQITSGEMPEDPREVPGLLGELSDLPDCPAWIREMVGELGQENVDPQPHPTGAFVLRGRRQRRRDGGEEGLAQEDDTASATVEVALDDHCRGVAEWAARLAQAYVVEDRDAVVVWPRVAPVVPGGLSTLPALWQLSRRAAG